MILTFLQAGGAAELLPTILMMVGVFGIMYFLMIRPQQQRQKKEKTFQEALKKGDMVVTTSGIHGRVAEISTDSAVIETMAGKIKIEKSAISNELTQARYGK